MLKILLYTMLGGIVINNLAFDRLLGICPIIGGSSTGKKSLVTGVLITLVMLVSTAICWPLQYFFLTPNKLLYLEPLVYVIVVVDILVVLELLVREEFKDSLGLYFPVIALNSAVLGIALNNSVNPNGLHGYDVYLDAVVASLGAGLGFLLAMLLFAGVKSRIKQKNVPAAFKGLPVSVLAAAIMAMAFAAFK